MKKLMFLIVAILTLTGVGRSQKILIDPASLLAEASSESVWGTPAMAAVDGTGMVGDTHVSWYTNCWLSDVGVADQWLKVNLGGSYNLVTMKFWNYHQSGCCDNRSVKEADIYVSSTGTGNPRDNAPEWQLVIPNQAFTQAPTIDNSNPDIIDLGGVQADFVCIVINSNYGSNDVGIAEVQFFWEDPFPKAINHLPVDEAIDMNRGSIELSWDTKFTEGPTTFDITIATDANFVDVVIDNEAATSPYTPSVLLDNGTTYYWRVDVTDGDPAVEYLGNVLSFTTSGKASMPSPADGSSGVVPDVALSWTGDSLGGYYEVLFGTSPDNLQSLGKVNSPQEIAIQELDDLTKYYWQVNELDGSGVAYAQGDVWSFTTGGLMGHWKLDGDVTDSSGNGNDGTISGGVSMVKGVIDQGASFNGADGEVTIADSASLNPGHITISFWVNPFTLAGQGNLISKRNVSNQGGYVIELNAGSVSNWFSTSVGWQNVIMNYVANQWQHVVVSYDGHVIRGYRNTELQDENEVESLINDDDGPLMFGNTVVQPRFFNGILDDIRIYNYAISEEDIRALYEQSPFAKYPDPADGAEDVPLDKVFGWQGGAGALSHELIIGTAVDANGVTDVVVQEDGLTESNYTLTEPLDLLTKYYWQVNEDFGEANSVPGPIWSFTTIPPQAFGPSPADLSTNVMINQALTWNAAPGGPYTHHVFFGDNFSTISEVAQLPHAITSYTPAEPMGWNKTYYWRIDEEDDQSNILPGSVWRFTTINPVCTPPAGDVNGDCVVDLADIAEVAATWLTCGYEPVEACP